MDFIVFHCNPAVPHRMMDHFINEIIDGILEFLNFFHISQKTLVILSYQQQECRKIFKQSYHDKINQNEFTSMYSHVARPKRNGYFIMVASIHCFTIFPLLYRLI